MIDLDDLSDRELDLVTATEQGNVLTCGDLSPVELAASRKPQHLVRAEVLRSILLGRLITTADPHGLRLHNARIIGLLDLEDLHSGIRLELHNCALDEPIIARDAHLNSVELNGSHVPAFHADRLRVDHHLFLRNGFTAHAEKDAVRLPKARIGGTFDCEGAILTSVMGRAMSCGGLRVDDDVFLRNGFVAHAEKDAVQLYGMRVGGNLDCSGAVLTSTGGVGLNADSMHVGGDAWLNITVHTKNTALWLVDAHIGGVAVLGPEKIASSAGRAVDARRLNVAGGVILRKGLTTTGHHPDDTVCLDHATLLGLDCDDVSIRNSNGRVSLGLRGTTCTWVRLPQDLLCPTGTTRRCDGTPQVRLDGLVYSSLDDDGADWQTWLHWLRLHTPTYVPQPYQQLAAHQRGAGHDHNARTILIAQQHDLHNRGFLGNRWARTRHRVWGALAGYGYRPGRLAAALLVALLIAGTVGVAAGNTPTHDGRYAALHTNRAERPFTPCSITEQIGLGIDRGLPLGTTGIRERCDLDTTTAPGQLYTAAIWILQAFVWALATLAIAGYTGLIRKPS